MRKNNLVKYSFMLFWVVASLSCSASPKVNQSSESMFQQFESRLLAAESIRFDFQITAEGAIEVDISGSFELIQQDQIHILGTGSFAGSTVNLSLHLQANQLQMSNGNEETTMTRPKEVENALLIGWTRMGILHNLAKLLSASAPDHADGNVHTWVVVANLQETSTSSATSTFDLVVDGTPSGAASITWNAAGLPMERHQTVHFPDSEMHVMERYSQVQIIGS